MAVATIESPLGMILVEARGGLICRLEIGQSRKAPSAEEDAPEVDSEALERIFAEIRAYFRGSLRGFTVPVQAEGPAFHMRVWDFLRSIPFGSALTYSEVARETGSPLAARAVGNACARNPVPLIIPCHRVLAADGLGGYGPGLDAKRWLLRHEGYPLPAGY